MQTLFDLSHSNRTQLFFAIDSQQGWDLKAACSLTPRVMPWSDAIWLLDITPCLNYWKHDGVALSFWSEVLQRLTLPCSVQVAMANNPWQALLLLRQMKVRGLDGILSIAENSDHAPDDSQRHNVSSHIIARRIYSETSWEQWLCLARESSKHLAYHGLRGFSLPRFLKHLKLLERNASQLGLSGIGQYVHVPAPQFRKRYGSFVQLLWEWTWLRDLSTESEFPWRDLAISVKPSVSHHLDHPLSDWAHIEPLLCQDLNRLCDQPCFDQQEKVVRLEWRLVLTNLKTLPISLSFRHPHSLHQSRHQQKTALLQASYAFSRDIKNFKRHESLLDDDLGVWVIGWQLKVVEKITSTPAILSLFEKQHSPEMQRLQEIENSLPVALKEYGVASSWVPEEANISASSHSETERGSVWQSLLLAAASERPLYLLRRPQILSRLDESKAWKFCERTNVSWWHLLEEDLGEEKIAFYRDYYRMSDAQKRHWWVFQDTTKRWYRHGIFA